VTAVAAAVTAAAHVFFTAEDHVFFTAKSYVKK
jgi:hypothetical protein